MPKTNCIVDLLVFGDVNFFSCSQWTREGTLHDLKMSNVKINPKRSTVSRALSIQAIEKLQELLGKSQPSTLMWPTAKYPSEFGVIWLWLISYPRINPWFGTIAFKGGSKTPNHGATTKITERNPDDSAPRLSWKLWRYAWPSLVPGSSSETKKKKDSVPSKSLK